MTPPAAPDPDAEFLARLAAMDLSAAEHVHAQLLATTEPEAVASLSRAYARASRTLRQTLALKAKLARDAAEAGATSGRRAALDHLSRDLQGFDVDYRVSELQSAVDRVLYAEHPDDEPRREALMERLDRELDDWTEEADFAVVALDALVLRAAQRLELSQDLAVRWRDLPDAQVGWDNELARILKRASAAGPTPSADTG